MVDSNGRFTIGNREGNPDYTSDNDQKLIFGHSSPGTSFSTVRLQSSKNEIKDIIFKAEESQYDTDQNTVESVMDLDGTFNDGETYHFIVTQRLEFVKSSQGQDDTVKIGYTIKNAGSQIQKAGIRIMIDTMLAAHDDAPFKVVGYGNVTSELEILGSDVPSTYQVYDDLDNPTTFATGTLYLANDRKPDKVQFAWWLDIVDTEYSYNISNHKFGDTAVGIYFDPVSLAASTSTQVCTYYGVNSNLISDSNTDTLHNIGEQQFGVIVYDSLSERPVVGANVEIDGIIVPTDNNGLAIFDNFKDRDKKTFTVKVLKENYRTAEVPRDVLCGSFCGVMIASENASNEPSFLSAVLQSANDIYDLMTTCVCYDEVQPGETPDTNIMLRVANSGTANTYRLVQSGSVKYESTDGVFNIPLVTKDSKGNAYARPRIAGLSAGQDVKLQMVCTGWGVKTSKIGLVVSKPVLTPLASSGSTKFELGDKIAFTVPGWVPFMGDSQVSFGIDGLLPFEMVVEDSKVKVAIGKEFSKSPGDSKEKEKEKKDAITKYKESYDKMLKKLDNKNLDKLFKNEEKDKKFIEETYGAGPVKFNCKIMGYGEGILDGNGNVNVEIGAIVTVSEKKDFTKQFFAGYIPMYITIGEKGEIAATIKGNLVFGDRNVSFAGGDATINPSFMLSPELGVGVNGALSISLQGDAKIDWLHRFTNSYDKVDLSGSIKLKAKILFLESEFGLIDTTCTLYDSNARQINADDTEQKDVSFKESDFKFVGRNMVHLKATRSNGIALSSMYTDVKEITVSGKRYRFFLADVADRQDADRSSIAYQVYENNEWSDPKLLLDGSGNSVDDGTADFNFALAADGNNIHLVWQNMNKKFESNSVEVEEMVSSSTITYCKLNTLDNSISNVINLAQGGAFSPTISAENDNVKIAWFSNSQNNVYGKLDKDGNYIGDDIISCVKIENGTPGNVVNVSAGKGKRIVSLSVGKLDSNDVVVYALSEGNMMSNAIHLYKQAFPDSDQNQDSAVQLSVEAFRSANAKFANLVNTSTMFYYSDGNIAYTENGTDIQKVFNDNDRPDGLNDAFTVLSGSDGKCVILWVAQEVQELEAGEKQTKQNIYAVNYDGSNWSGAYMLKTIDNAEAVSAPTGYIDALGNIVLSYGYNPNKKSAELMSETISEFKDISLDYVDFEQNDVEPGKAFAFKIDLTNKGSGKVDNVAVQIQDSSGETVGTGTIAVDLEPGQSIEDQAVTTTYIVPTLNKATEYKVKVSAADENRLSDNTKDIVIGYTDLAVTQNARFLMAGDDYIALKVSNKSHFAAKNVRVRVLADSLDGVVIYDRHLNEIAGGEEQIFNLNINQLSNVGIAYAMVSTDSDDYIENNNKELLAINPFRMQENLSTYDFFILAQEGGRIVEGTSGQYEANTSINIEAAASDGYRFTGWQISAGTAIDVSSLKTVFTMPQENATVIAGFEKLDDSDSTDKPSSSIPSPVVTVIPTPSPVVTVIPSSISGGGVATIFTPTPSPVVTVIPTPSPVVTVIPSTTPVIISTMAPTVTPSSSSSPDNDKYNTDKVYEISNVATVMLNKETFIYNGKVKRPFVTVVNDSVELTENTDYTVSYYNNTKVGTASVIITGIGNYSGIINKTFKIVPKGTPIKGKPSAKHKGFVIKWKKQPKSVTGYQVQYSTNKKFKGKTTAIKTVKKKSITKFKAGKLKAKKKYYVRVRTYKTVKGKKYYSRWSTSIAVITKR